jgi:intracellular sulfur oxidation DsrE/DsrF family protein
MRYSLSKILTLPLVMAAVMLACPSYADSQDQDSDDVVKVVYHADFSDARRFSAMLTSINNMVTFYQDELIEYDVRIVFVSHGIRFLTDDRLEKTPFKSDVILDERRDNLKGRLTALQDVQEVKLELCDITRSQIDLANDKLYDGVETVPSGVVRIADLQNQGFAYIKIE